MGHWRIGADGLARSRFTVSALTQTLEAVGSLYHGDPVPSRQAWAREHRPAFQRRLATDPVAAAFVRDSTRPRWIADFITVPPRRGDRTFHDELRQVRRAPLEAVRRELSWGGSLDPALRGRDVVERCADLLEWVWTHTVRPDWPRLRQVFEADILSRTQLLATQGWAAALDGLRPGTRWLGDGRLQINSYDNPPRDITDAELMFIPCTTRRGWVSWDEPDRYAIVYPCTGALADVGAVKPPDALARLIGANRGAVLMALVEPRSTSQLVALTGYGLGSVGGHLKILLDADLVARRRSGRSVLYYRTRLGDTLVGRNPSVTTKD
jgi:DNA-binding transcriptional ArsR family regulator